MSDMQRILIADATPTQLSKFATEYLSLPNCNLQKGKIVLAENIRASGYDRDYIELPHEAPTNMPAAMPNPADSETYVKPSGNGGATDADRKAEEYVVIQIAPGDPNDPGANRPVFVSVNTRGIYIPVGDDVCVKRKFYTALRRAIKSQPVLRDGKIVGSRDVPLHSVSFVRDATQADIDGIKQSAEKHREMAAQYA